jgi:uncharacterized membrane protein
LEPVVEPQTLPNEVVPGAADRSRAAWLAAVSLVLALAGIVASSMLVVDYLRPAPVFCSEGGGCEALKHTPFAMPLGIPLPLLGLAGFAALGAWALVPGKRARVVQLVLAVGAGAVGLSLLVMQVLYGHFCPYCCVAETRGAWGWAGSRAARPRWSRRRRCPWASASTPTPRPRPSTTRSRRPPPAR